MKGSFEKKFLFLLSPFLSLPLIFKDIYQRKERNFILLALIFGILSYAYLPAVTNDKAYYYILYEDFKRYGFGEMLLFLADKPDFIFYTLIFLFSKIEIPIQFLFLILTSLTVWTWFYAFKEISKKYDLANKRYFLFFSLILFSFSLGFLFSGTRNYFAFAFIVLAFFKGLIDNSTKVGLIYVLLAISIHFSSLIFLPVYLILIFYPKKYKWYNTAFVISFIFLLIPRGILLDMATALKLPEVFRYKIEGYLGEKDFIENSLKVGNLNNYLRIISFTLWTYFAWFYLFLTFKRKSMLRNITLIAFTVSNIFYSAPGTYFRYLLIPQIFFILLLIHEYALHRTLLRFSKLLLIVFLINFFGNIYGHREQYIKSYLHFSSWTSITIFMKDKITSKDFIQ